MNNQFSQLPSSKKVFVASDFHLGAPTLETSQEREKKIVRWLEQIEPELGGLILAGDLFDFWFEYKRAVPKGGIRLLGKLAALSDRGIPIIVFAGNHDIWYKDYLSKELNARIYHKPVSFQFPNTIVHIGHGDGIGPGGKKFKTLKKIFTAGINKALFRWLHPDIGIRMGLGWCAYNRKRDLINPDPFLEKGEPIFIYCENLESNQHHDYYIFGHRHIPHQLSISDNATYINSGDWIIHSTYVEIDGSKALLKTFNN